tara:strand:- start:2018 stop:2266 length:249 start_codon:yes stop_codon:yes gene_type:complete
MAKYKFPAFETVFENPTITINGDVGTRVINNVPSNTAYCDILIETPQTSKSSFRLEGTPQPIDWTMEELSIWVANQLIQYEV